MDDLATKPKRNTTRRTQAERSAASRAGLIESAIDYIRRRGLAATNMTEIAAAAKLTRGAIQYHFASRTDLILAVVEEMDARLCRSLESFTIPPSVSGPDRVRAMLDQVISITTSKDNIAAYDVWSASRSDPTLRERTQGLQRQLTVQFREFWWRNLQGHLPTPQIELSFDITLMMSRGAAMGQLLDDPTEEIRRCLTATKRLLTEYLNNQV